ncbi:hypothetical protein J2S00_003074 [Caldalkalibacillus uzonensis]|uniref:DUF3168 domain-containing protein n=1 Tax=Caldalkalibacillus uzonensis TaxID=353224 RepID=A0ABU0CV09_9BACI|nr:hypothetical protein [Caldalkalibacillus uzonensis]
MKARQSQMTLNRVIELRKAIKAAIKEVHSEVYFEKATDDSPYPYIVFDLPNSISNGALENFVLEVEGWDAPTNSDTTGLEMMMDAVDKALQRKTFVIADNLFFSLYRDGRESINENDSLIKRRRYTYQARVYGE